MCRVGPLPVERERDLLEPGQRAHLLLPDVMRPAAAVHALAAAQHGQREERPVDLVGVEPVVGARAHRDHRAAPGQLGVAGELARHPRRGRRGHRGDRLLPGRRVRAAGRRTRSATRRAGRRAAPRTGPSAGRTPSSPAGRRPACAGTPRRIDRAALGRRRRRSAAGRPARPRRRRPYTREQRVDPAQVEVPAALARLGEARSQRAVREHRLARSPRPAGPSCAPRLRASSPPRSAAVRNRSGT